MRRSLKKGYKEGVDTNEFIDAEFGLRRVSWNLNELVIQRKRMGYQLTMLCRV
jgi:hypothetical protein